MVKTNRCSKQSLNNRGYSMVEMIIVIAIVAILSALSFLTVNIIYSAKATAAGDAFNTQLSRLASLTKAQDANLAMKLYYNDTEKKYYLQYGTYDGSSFTADADMDEVGLSDGVTIYYTPSDTSSETKIDSTNSGVIIKFNKSDGSVMYGAGSYRIAKGENGNSYSIVLNKNTGSHYTK